MRKVKVTLKPESSGKKLYVFNTSDAIASWFQAVERGDLPHVDELEELLLEPDGFIEAELMGFEYVYENNNHKRYDFIRLGKAQRPKNASGYLVTVHSGWVVGGLLPLRRYSDHDIDVVPITDVESVLDFSTLFKDNDDER